MFTIYFNYKSPIYRCSNPQPMRAHMLDSVDPKYLTCEPVKTDVNVQMTHAYIFYMTFFMMCSIFFIAIFLYRSRFAAPPGDRHSSIYYLKAQTNEGA